MSADQCSLNQLKNGERAVFTHCQSKEMTNRLYSMGILPGHSIQVVRKVPFGGSMYIKIGDRPFALRESEARQIEVSFSES